MNGYINQCGVENKRPRHIATSGNRSLPSIASGSSIRLRTSLHLPYSFLQCRALTLPPLRRSSFGSTNALRRRQLALSSNALVRLYEVGLSSTSTKSATTALLTQIRRSIFFDSWPKNGLFREPLMPLKRPF
jgi:hypothetical protein